MSYLVVSGLYLLNILLLCLLFDAYITIKTFIFRLSALILPRHFLSRSLQQLMQQHKLLLIALENHLLGFKRNGSAQFIDQPHLKQLIDQPQYLVGSPLPFVHTEIHLLQSLQIILHLQYKRMINKIGMKLLHQKTKLNPFGSIREKKIKQIGKSLEDKEVIESLYNADKLTCDDGVGGKFRGKSMRRGRDSKVNVNLAANCSFMELGRELKSKRTLIEQNTELRKKVESLVQGKSTKRGSTIKKLSTEFEKEIYWNGSQSYMISGVKLQYQKMKEDYIKKCDQYDQLMRSAVVANNMEFLAYIEALEVENHILARQLDSYEVKNKEEVQNYPMIIYQLKDRIAKYEVRMNQMKEKSKKSRRQAKQLRKKVEFLEKLVISKDNNEHIANRNAKKFEKEKQQLIWKVEQFQKVFQIMRAQHQKTVDELKQNHQERLDSQLNKQVEHHKEQHNIINRLQRENKYLQNLVDCWKEEKSPRKEHHNYHHHTKETHHSKAKLDKIVAEQHQTVEQQQARSMLMKTAIVAVDKDYAEELMGSDGEDEARTVPFTSDRKNSANSIKNRRVQAYEIEGIIEFSKYNLIFKGLSIDEVCKLFENDDDEWSKQYINMKQVKTIIQNHLSMNEHQALLVARYMIEHSHAEYVFTDDLNEHHRSVVKSIVRSLYGNYPIFQTRRKEFEQLIASTRGKLEWTLENTTKGGVVDRQKFTDLLQSLSISISNGFDTYCIAKMASGSLSFQKLKYSLLYSGSPPST